MEEVRFGNNLFRKSFFSFLDMKKELGDGNTILHLAVKKKRIILDLIPH